MPLLCIILMLTKRQVPSTDTEWERRQTEPNKKFNNKKTNSILPKNSTRLNKRCMKLKCLCDLYVVAVVAVAGSVRSVTLCILCVCSVCACNGWTGTICYFFFCSDDVSESIWCGPKVNVDCFYKNCFNILASMFLFLFCFQRAHSSMNQLILFS